MHFCTKQSHKLELTGRFIRFQQMEKGIRATRYWGKKMAFTEKSR